MTMTLPTGEDEELRPRQKAATLMLAIGAKNAASVLRYLTEDEVETLAMEIARLGTVAPEIQTEVLQEFYETATAHRYMVEGGVEYARQILEQWKGSRGEEILDRLLQSVQVTPFNFLAAIEPDQLLQFLQDEHPQTVTLILSHLPYAYSAKVLSGLTEAKQAEVAMRLATMDRIAPEVVRRVEDNLKLRLGSVTHAELTTQRDGVKDLAEMLNQVDRTTERAILTQLAEHDPELADKVRALMFIFEDVATLHDRDIQEILRNVDTKGLALAMKGVREDVRQAIFRNLSERAALSLQEEVEVLGAVKIKDVEEAQSKIVAVIRGLDEAGKIVVRRSAEGGMVE
jgi:flagellar motor switch protein FliG